jgi:hypothetical protein
VNSVRSLGDPGNFWVAFPVFGRTKSALPGDALGVSVLFQVVRIPPSDLREALAFVWLLPSRLTFRKRMLHQEEARYALKHPTPI